MQKVKVTINGQEKDAILIEKLYKNRKKRVIKNKLYVWEEYYIHVYVPSELRDKKFVLVPI